MEYTGQIGDVGSYDVTINEQGQVDAKVQIAKKLVNNGVQAAVNLEVKVDIFALAEALAAKTGTTWDDAAVQALEKLVGYTKPTP